MLLGRTIGEQKIDMFADKFNKAKGANKGFNLLLKKKGLFMESVTFTKFMTLALTEPMFQQALAVMPYMNSP